LPLKSCQHSIQENDDFTHNAIARSVLQDVSGW
jgi:hypothetical protein